MTVEQIGLYSDIAKIIAAFVAFIGLIFTGIQIRFLYRTQQEANIWHRKKAAQDAVWNLHTLTDCTMQLDKLFQITTRKEPIDREELIKILNMDKKERLNVQRLLNSYDAIARGVFQGIYDEEVIKAARKGALIRQFRNFSIYIEYLRYVEEKPTAYKQLEKIALKWDSSLESVEAIHSKKALNIDKQHIVASRVG